MEIAYVWNDQIPEKDGSKVPVNDMAFSPDGTRIIAAVGNRVLLYRASDGDLLESLRGHKDTVNSVSYSADGTRFASGGADNIVIIWKSTGQGLLKYNHSAPIQKVRYNPTAVLLASCSEVDFGLWTPDQKQVTKEKVPSRILAAAWSGDGTLLALGLLNGMISIRNQHAEEILKFERRAPIWCLCFISEPSSGSSSKPAGAGGNAGGAGGVLDHADNLAVGCWDKTYSLYRLTSKSALLNNEKSLPYYPLSMHCVSNSIMKTSYIMMAGSNKLLQVLSREGTKLAVITKPADSWLWSTDSFIEDDLVTFGTQNGSVEMMKVNFNSIHSLYRDRYAYRENLTEVIVHHLITDKKVRIKCKDMIHNLSLFRNKLAVQLLDRICIYESSSDDSVDIHFRLRKEKIVLSNSALMNIETKIVFNLMLTTSFHVLIAFDNVLELYNMDGTRQKLWKLEGNINCLKVDGGPEGQEGVLIGLSNGCVWKLFINNPFPIEVTKRSKSVKKVDLNITRQLLATIDEDNQLVVTDLATQESLFQLQGVKACCFNNEVDDLLSVTMEYNNSISVISGLVSYAQIKYQELVQAAAAASGTGNSSRNISAPLRNSPEVQEQHLFGTTLGFRGQKIFALNKGLLVSIDVPQGMNMVKHLENNDFNGAYKVACLGATEVEWRSLGMKALRANQLTIAKNAFARLKEIKYLNLIELIEKNVTVNTLPPVVEKASVNSTDSTAPTAGRGRSRHALLTGNSNATASGSNAASSSAVVTIPPLESKWLAEIMAYEGHYHEAAKLLARGGRVDDAIAMFINLKKWEDAKTFARNSTKENPVEYINLLTAQQAKWLHDIKDWKTAAELYASLGQYYQAAKLIGDNLPTTTATLGANKEANTSNNNLNTTMTGEDTPAGTGTSTTASMNHWLQRGWYHTMIDIVRSCSVEDKETLSYCGDKLATLEDVSFAKEAYLKGLHYNALMTLYVKRQMWEEATKLADDFAGQFDMTIFLSYAEWLLSEDRYEDAMEAFKKCHRHDLSRKVLKELTTNAVVEKRFKDAGYYFWSLAKDLEYEIAQWNIMNTSKEAEGKNNNSTTNTTNQPTEQQLLVLQSEYIHKADLYYAYASIHSYVTDPFTSYQPDMLFQVARFIINSLGNAETIPLGISKMYTLYTLAKQAMMTENYKLARHVYDRLSKLHITSDSKAEEIELDMLLIQSKPVRDNSDYLPVCYRCGTTNPLLNPFTNQFAKGDICTNCGHPFVRSFINFDVLPLVEFVPQADISDEEAIDLIRQPPRALIKPGMGNAGNSKWREETTHEGANVLSLGGGGQEPSLLDQSVFNEQEGLDLFSHCLTMTLEKQKNNYIPVQVDPNTLLAMKRSEVFVCKPSSKNKRATFYKNMLAEIPIAISQPCHRFFHLEDFEFAYLSEKRCPYSRLVNVGEYGSV